MKNEKLLKAQDVFLDKVSHMCSKLGLNNIMAQLYAVLYLSDKPLSLNDMVEQLKISKGSVSVNIRALEGYGAVKRAWIKGTRKDYYEAELDIFRVVLGRVKSIAQSRLLEMESMINSTYKTLNSPDLLAEEEKEDEKIFRQRLDKLRGLYNQAQSLFKIFDSGLVSNMLIAKAKKNSKKETKTQAVFVPEQV